MAANPGSLVSWRCQNHHCSGRNIEQCSGHCLTPGYKLGTSSKERPCFSLLCPNMVLVTTNVPFAPPGYFLAEQPRISCSGTNHILWVLIPLFSITAGMSKPLPFGQCFPSPCPFPAEATKTLLHAGSPQGHPNASRGALPNIPASTGVVRCLLPSWVHLGGGG